MTIATLCAALCAALLVLDTSPAAAQNTTIAGIVRSSDGRPIEGVNVFVLETLDGAVTTSDGRFRISADTVSITLIARGIGFRPYRRVLPLAGRDSLVIVLEHAPPSLVPVNIQAGRYTANDERSATLTSLDVVTTPGAAADVNRAIQTLPGVQQVDEGNGLFVRGGDYTETKVFLDDATVLNPASVQSPDGTFEGTVDPFLLDGIVFSSGGFGARYGDAMSGVVNLHTQGRATRNDFTVGAGLAAASLSGGAPINGNFGVRAAANAFDIRPLLALNGGTREYSPAPHGHDLSGSVVWKGGRAGEIALFAINQTEKLGVGVTDPSFDGTYALDTSNDLIVVTWNAVFGRFTPSLSISTTSYDRSELFGAFDLGTHINQQHLLAQTEWTTSDRLTLRAGAELERLRSAFDGTVPADGSDVSTNARTRVVGSAGTGTRSALFTEAEARVGTRTKLILGVRSDSSSLTHERTIDPRASGAMKIDFITLTGAWGIYHEVPDPMLFDPTLGIATLPSMRAIHTILGIQAGEDNAVARIEVYDKRYESLAAQTRDYGVSSDGNGYARGVDVFLKATMIGDVNARLTYSYLRARRTDPDAHVLADAPYDVPQTVTLVLKRTFSGGWTTGATYRYASGRPYSPITSATFDAAEHRWIPVYGDAMSERFPAFTRVDLSVSRYRPLNAEWKYVIYASVNNLFDRSNVYTYSYSTDYSQRMPVRSLFNRSLYVGATLIH